MSYEESGVEFEILELKRAANGTMQARVRYASGVEAVRQVKSVELSAEVIRANGQREDLGLIAGTYANPVTEMRARSAGVGSVTLPEGEALACE